MASNRQWLLRNHPVGNVRETDFEVRSVEIPEPSHGEALGATRWLTFEPAIRSWLDGDPDRFGRTAGVPAAGYAMRVEPGEVVKGPAAVEIVESRRDDLRRGDLVRGPFGWQEHVLIGPDAEFQRLDPSIPLPLSLGVLGSTGLTAYFGLLGVGALRSGETVVVSGAAGAVGSVAAQIARLKGCRVIGVAGGEEKCRWLLESCRLDEAIDHRHESVAARLRALCPDAIDLFFDNVGGAVLEAAIANMATHGRIVLCGQIATYDTALAEPGPRNLFHLIARRVRMEGFLLRDFAADFARASAELRAWEGAGDLAHREDVQEGFEQIPRTLLRVFSGENVGRQLLRL